jgi:hypothetical protein
MGDEMTFILVLAAIFAVMAFIGGHDELLKPRLKGSALFGLFMLVILLGAACVRVFLVGKPLP